MSSNRVSAREINAFLREHRRLVELGQGATYEESLAYHRQKADLFQRIAAQPGPLVDPEEAASVAKAATQKLTSTLRYVTAIGGRP